MEPFSAQFYSPSPFVPTSDISSVDADKSSLSPQLSPSIYSKNSSIYCKTSSICQLFVNLAKRLVPKSPQTDPTCSYLMGDLNQKAQAVSSQIEYDDPWHLKTYLAIPRSEEQRERLADPFYFPVFYRIWTGLMVSSTLFNYFAVPIHTAFRNPAQCHMMLWLSLEIFFECIYLLDMVLQIFISNNYKLSHSQTLMIPMRNQIHKITNVLSSIPVVVLSILTKTPCQTLWVVILRYFKLLRTQECRWVMRSSHKNATYYKLIKVFQLMNLLFYVGLWTACCWIVIGKIEGNWMHKFEGGITHLPPLHQLVNSFFWSTCTLTSAGFGDIVPTPNTKHYTEHIYAMIVMIIGISGYSSLFALFGNQIENIHGAAYRQKRFTETVLKYVKKRRIGSKAREEVHEHYTKYHRHYSPEAVSVYADLPLSVRLELANFLYQEMFQKITLLRHCDRNMLRELSIRITPQIFLKGQYIVQVT